MKGLVVGVDGTEKDGDVIDWVIDFALETGARVSAAHFVPRASLWMIAGAQIDAAHYLQELRTDLESGVLRRLQSRLGPVHLYLEAGDPAHELADLAARTGAGLIVIGSPDHTAVHDVVFGNFERRLVHHAGVPVVTIPCGTRTLRPVP